MIKTATIAQVNGDTTLTFEFVAPTTSMLKYALAWAEYDFDHGWGDHGTEEAPIVFGDLTNQQRVDIILDRVFSLGKAEAMAQIRADAIPDAVAAADMDEIDNI